MCRRDSYIFKMGKIHLFEVILNREQDVYFPGETIEGHISLITNEDITMRGILVTFRGFASTHWSEKHMTGSAGSFVRTMTRYYSASEDYFEDVIQLYGFTDQTEADDDGDVCLNRGEYKFPFRYQIHQDLPSSFEGQFGHIRYIVRGVIDRKSSKSYRNNYTTKRIFTLNSLIDLSQDPSVLTEVQRLKSKSICCMCCKSGPITVRVHLPRRAYVPGDSIMINAEIDNMSRRDIDYTAIKLIMYQAYHTSKKDKVVTVPITTMQWGRLRAGDSCVWSKEELRVPSLPPSYLVNCRIMTVKYALEVKVVPAFAQDIVFYLNVLIGNIPIKPEKENTVLQSRRVPRSWKSTSSLLSAAYNIDYSAVNLPSHRFEEYSNGRVNVREKGLPDHVHGQIIYTPLYVMFDEGHLQYSGTVDSLKNKDVNKVTDRQCSS